MVAPDTSSAQHRLVPAGHAIAIVLLSLIGFAILDADAMTASIEQQRFGTSRTVELALSRPIRTVSHWTGLNRPRRWLDELINGRSHPVQPPRVPVALPAVDLPSADPRTRPATGPGAPTIANPARAPAPAVQSPVVTRRIPTAAQPLKVWMAGDSLMGSVSESFAGLAKSLHNVSVTDNIQIGTGLARPDVYDWPAAISRQIAATNPDVVVLLFGANDDQDMQVDGHRVVRGTDTWRQEYARRVSQVMAVATAGHRQLIWVGVPAVKRPRLNQTKDVMNQVAQATAALYPGVTFIDTGATLDGPGASYVTYLAGASGQPVKVRESDGIHFTLAGANRVTPLILSAIERVWRLTP
jgi:uncharacterized protein